jgi:hypothetical protein
MLHSTHTKGHPMKQSITQHFFLLGAVFLIALAFPVSALADGGGEDGVKFSQTINGYKITLIFDEPPVIGENSLHILVVDEMGLPVSDAVVEVSMVVREPEHKEPSSSAHGDTPKKPAPEVSTGHGAMSDKDAPVVAPTEAQPDSHDDEPADSHAEMEMTTLEAGHDAGEYAGHITIPGAGEWNLRVHMTMADELTEIDFPLDVAGSLTGAGILTGFAVFNVAILFAAAIFKSNRT